MTEWFTDRFKVNFLARIAVQDDGCWLWIGGGSRERYGRFYAGDTSEQWAHRNAWRLHTGQPIPDGIQIHHQCGVPKCVNPMHLEAVDPREHVAIHVAANAEARPHGCAKYDAEKCRCDVCRAAHAERQRESLARLRSEAAAGLRPIPHGTKDGHARFQCKCDACRTAARDAKRAYDRARGVQPRQPMRHGTTSMYTKGKCRCDLCRANWASYWRQRRAAKRVAS